MIHFDANTVEHEKLKSVIEAVGYTATQSNSDVKNNTDTRYDNAQTKKIGSYPFFIGIAAALAVVGFYLGLLTLTSDWYSAKMQFIEYRWWIIALSLGLGTQATLFSFMRKKIFGQKYKGCKIRDSGFRRNVNRIHGSLLRSLFGASDAGFGVYPFCPEQLPVLQNSNGTFNVRRTV